MAIKQELSDALLADYGPEADVLIDRNEPFTDNRRVCFRTGLGWTASDSADLKLERQVGGQGGGQNFKRLGKRSYVGSTSLRRALMERR